MGEGSIPKKGQKIPHIQKNITFPHIALFSLIIRYYVAAMHVVDFFFSTRNDYIHTYNDERFSYKIIVAKDQSVFHSP